MPQKKYLFKKVSPKISFVVVFIALVIALSLTYWANQQTTLAFTNLF